jgi:hypothetical protein
MAMRSLSGRSLNGDLLLSRSRFSEPLIRRRPFHIEPIMQHTQANSNGQAFGAINGQAILGYRSWVSQ